MSPWRFRAPLSPDMAAAREGRAIEFERLVAFSRAAVAADSAPLFIEGVGGVMVPLTDRHTVLDWMAAVAIPAIVVTGTYLGTISHTLTALEVLQRRSIAVKLVVVNESAPAGAASLSETVSTLVQHTARLSPPLLLLTRGKAFAPEQFRPMAAALGLAD
jgi:dethiobiotin synthetase